MSVISFKGWPLSDHLHNLQTVNEVTEPHPLVSLTDDVVPDSRKSNPEQQEYNMLAGSQPHERRPSKIQGWWWRGGVVLLSIIDVVPPSLYSQLPSQCEETPSDRLTKVTFWTRNRRGGLYCPQINVFNAIFFGGGAEKNLCRNGWEQPSALTLVVPWMFFFLWNANITKLFRHQNGKIQGCTTPHIGRCDKYVNHGT